ncbi:hypothetical protein HJFPF1_10912 [Paramyrothecium foliicola]|nr:hypothetical protein HJFPF1_10912 [Paramyrothecium foliicola]
MTQKLLTDPLRWIFHHVFLPPRLPSGEEEKSFEEDLVTLLISSLQQFIRFQEEAEAADLIEEAISGLKGYQKSQGFHGGVSENDLKELLGSLSEQGKYSGMIPLHIVAQNAGMLMRKTSSGVVIETFRLSPSNGAVYASPGRLKRKFPEAAVVLPLQAIADSEVKSSIACTLEKMSRQPVAEMQPRVRKAKHMQIEERDTVKPFIVTNLFLGIIQALGGCQIQLPKLWKHTREEVMWNHGSKLPWRRSPVWLLLRVALQRTLSPSGAPEEGCQDLYKRFMIFFLSCYLEICLENKSESAVLHIINAKLHRRILKLNLKQPSDWMNLVASRLSRSSQMLEARWAKVVEADTTTLDIPSLNCDLIGQDTRIAIPDLDDYLGGISKRTSPSSSTFYPPRPGIRYFESSELPEWNQFVVTPEPYHWYNLALLEDWVAVHLDTWVESYAHDASSCEKIQILIKSYAQKAEVAYRAYPEGNSIMYLTILELWIACDKLAVGLCPLIADYEPEIPVGPWSSLMLKSCMDMKRLSAAEDYITRRSKSSTSNQSILFGFGTVLDFGVRFFASSPFHQELLQEIEEDARQEREAKYKEFDRLKDEYHSLLVQRDSLECEYMSESDEHGNKYQVKSPWCRRCQLQQRAEPMKIQAHEWPLPDNQHLAEAVVFELRAPKAFGIWRDCTLLLLHDVFQFERSVRTPCYWCHLEDYSGLRRYFAAHSTVVTAGLLSEVKPHYATHRRESSVSTAQRSDVCLETGPRWSLFDNKNASFVSRLSGTDHISKTCTLGLPPSSQTLETFLCRLWRAPDGVPANTVISNQHNCPPHFSIQEFKALCNLPLGQDIQWFNLLIQLAMPSIDLNRVETLIFIWQLSEQCGPSLSTWRRLAHRWFEDADFRTLKQKAFGSQDDDVRLDFAQRAHEAALICLVSFDVDNKHLSSLLGQTETAQAYFESLITLHDTSFGANKENLVQTHLSLRCHRLIKRCHQVIQTTRNVDWVSGLDLAMSANWSNLKRLPDHEWRMMELCWLHTIGEASASGSVQVALHFNLVTGEFLVNGLPPGRLPTAYERHPTYELLFGRVAFDAMPVADSGMKFSATKTFQGFSLQFSLDGLSSDLLVQARQGSYSWELIPERLFREILPSTFSSNYVYWYDLDTSHIHLRSKQCPWSTSDCSWTMENNINGWILHDDHGNSLIYPKTCSAQRYGAVFEPLETVFGLEIVLKSQEESMEITIPRLNLGFFAVNGSDEIQSRQYRGMLVDKSQGLQTLVGLRSRLVLRSPRGNVVTRSVLIPDDVPRLSPANSGKSIAHVSVQISETASSTQLYALNTDLGQLTGNGTLRSRLFLAELHAITSNYIVDPFTGATGTEEALRILTSAAVVSLGIHNEDEVQILRRIGKLAPVRTHYPAHLNDMQVVEWKPFMSPLLQSDEFALVTRSLRAEAEKLAFLQKSPILIETNTASKNELIMRGLFRMWRPHYACDAPVPSDIEYTESEVSLDLEARTERATNFGTLLYTGDGSALLLQPGVEYCADRLYKSLTSEIQAQGAGRTVLSSEFGYDARYLEKSDSLLAVMLSQFHRTLTQTSHGYSKAQLVPWMAAFAFAKTADLICLQALLSCATLRKMRDITIPMNQCYNLAIGFEYNPELIRRFLRNHAIDFSQSKEAKLPRGPFESANAAKKRKLGTFNVKINTGIDEMERSLREQWPRQVPYLHCSNMSYFQFVPAQDTIRAQFRAWYDNREFRHYLIKICDVLCDARYVNIGKPDVTMEEAPCFSRSRFRAMDLVDLINLVPAPALPYHSTCRHGITIDSTQDNSRGNNLEGLSKSMRDKTVSKQESLYLDKLNQSILSLKGGLRHSRIACSESEIQANIITLQQITTNHHREVLQLIQSTAALEIAPTSAVGLPLASWQAATRTHCWPKTSIRHLLVLMQRQNWRKVPAAWKLVIVELATSLANVQSARRLYKARNNEQDLIQELLSMRERGWDPLLFPDSLLLEVEGDLRIRKVQEEIATVMMYPPEGQNAVMQLNMGEGKSTVIVPKVAASLADGSRLVRAIVAKPQSRQMFHILVSKLGGLLARRIYQMPLSRANNVTVHQVHLLDKHFKECAANGGILLVQPEHILSFQLMTIERAIMHEETLARALWNLQEFFVNSSRDIVDESDENFSTKFELVYTMGEQRAIEHGPDRWIVIQEVLALIVEQSRTAKKHIPRGIELDEQQRSSFPYIRFLNNEARQMVLFQTAAHLCHRGMHGFPISHETEAMRLNLLCYIIEVAPSSQCKLSVEGSDFWENYSRNLLLLRGLFAGGVLEHVFRQKRWRVNYGLDPRRIPSTRLAVPFHAKDSPTASSEFSHPDVVICLTCLSYYYGGLSDEDQTLSLQHLLRSDQADLEYQQWIETSDDLPRSFYSIQSVNLQDKEQCEICVFPHFRYSKGAVDYFLSHLVFNKEMKEFPSRLSASGWDLGKIKRHPLTGFSGTNDSQHVLPVSVQQLELEDQRHTNALVLDYIMRPENSVLSLAAVGLEGICGSKAFLAAVMKIIPQVRVVLDVGALMLDMTNEEFVWEWLRLLDGCADVQAAVYCNSVHEICVMDDRGHVELLSASPFAGQLDRCVVFLDEAHTRGIDLRLPLHYRAAVTLGAGVTKDRLVQACMRMRKLAFGQSVLFCVPEEVETKIRDESPYSHDQPLSVTNVLEWAISNTWADLRRSMPLWLNQGRIFAKQDVLWDRARAEDERHLIRNDLAKGFIEEEAKSLDARYQPKSCHPGIDDKTNCNHEIMSKILERCSQFEGLDMVSGTLQEEQERELAPEIEQERELERPAPATPATHRLHPDVESFVRSGKIIRRRSDDAFLWAFDVFKHTTLAREFNISNLPHGILVTKDFERTIKHNKVEACMDSYQRPVQWVLTDRLKNNKASVMVILSPFEATKLITTIEASKSVVLHLYAPQHNKGYRPLDSLTLFTIPGRVELEIPIRLRIELMLFSGQLYFNSFEQYVEVCNFLCLAHAAATTSMVVRSDGFIDPQSHDADRDPGTILRESPVKLLKAITTRIRKQCEGIEKTHLGKLLEGVLLVQEDFKH